MYGVCVCMCGVCVVVCVGPKCSCHSARCSPPCPGQASQKLLHPQEREVAVQGQGLGLAPEPSKAQSVLIWWQRGKGSLRVTLESGGAPVSPGRPVPNPAPRCSFCHYWFLVLGLPLRRGCAFCLPSRCSQPPVTPRRAHSEVLWANAPSSATPGTKEAKLPAFPSAHGSASGTLSRLAACLQEEWPEHLGFDLLGSLDESLAHTCPHLHL